MTVAVTINANIRALTEAAVAKASEAVRTAALEIEAQAKVGAPVDTGFLRSSIQAEMVGPLEATVTSYASYSIYQEYGTRYMAAQPYMTPAAEFVRPVFLRAMASII